MSTPHPGRTFPTSAELRRKAFSIYRFALAAAWRSILRGSRREGLKLLIAPVGYWRFLVNAVVLEMFERSGARHVLDVSSPKLLSLMLARQAEVWATDLDDKAIFDQWKKLADTLGLERYHVEYQDARKLGCADGSFDFVYSISVIEHIPDGGDTEALREFSRVLKPGGLLIVEVPYRRQRNEIVARYDSKGAPLAEPQFYERHYDAQWLRERLHVEGLEIEHLLILGESFRVDPWISGMRLPRLLRIGLLPFEPWLAAANYWIRCDDLTGNPLAAMIVYRRR